MEAYKNSSLIEALAKELQRGLLAIGLQHWNCTMLRQSYGRILLPDLLAAWEHLTKVSYTSQEVRPLIILNQPSMI